MNKKAVIISFSIVVVAVALFVGLKSMKNTSFSNANELPASQYASAPKSFAGNIYTLTAQIDSQLAYDDIVGRMLLIKTDCAIPLPLFVSNSLAGFNPMAGQKYKFTVKISGDGMLTLTNFKKI